jgi:3-oxoacyl-[acyl-carrier protein] reductase
MPTEATSERFPRVVLITGGASGIGFETAVQAATAGARVAVLDRDGVAARAAVARLPDGQHAAVEADVADRAAVDAAIEEIVEQLGPPEAVVAAAGIVSRTALREVSGEEFDRVLRINVGGVQNVIAAVVPHLMVAAPRASIVALGSVAASTGGGLMGGGLYAASKAAVVGLVRGYARELAPWGVRANVVAPGATETPMVQALSEEDRARIIGMSLLGRLSLPEEIAATVCFLLGAGAGSITGQVLQPNGGTVLT